MDCGSGVKIMYFLYLAVSGAEISLYKYRARVCVWLLIVVEKTRHNYHSLSNFLVKFLRIVQNKSNVEMSYFNKINSIS